jgi:hypothetical protein
MDRPTARAEAWIAAWNARDLDAVIDRLGRPDGTLRGKPELRACFARGMANPALHFTLDDVRLGVNALCILYTREGGKRCADTMQLDAQGHCRRMIACYAP